jgi:hypothetical protein
MNAKFHDPVNEEKEAEEVHIHIYAYINVYEYV